MQITKCPWCGAEIGIGGYSEEGGAMNIACHNNPKCLFHRHLPIYVVDDDIYRTAPTFILSTADHMGGGCGQSARCERLLAA